MNAERIGRIREALERELSPVQLDIVDDSAKHAGHAGAREGGHFRVRLVAEAFRGKSRIERHRLVFAALEGSFGRDIHALNIEARTPEESG
jgi:BolA family transcriptional regulator, general stress-responsive regulator